MTEQPEPAVNRIATEIWRIILDEAIDQHNPLFFSTGFEGSNWSKYSNWISFEKTVFWQDQEDQWQERAETQRRTIGSVCRSWQAFARSRRGLYFISRMERSGERPHEIDKALNARRVTFDHSIYRELARHPRFVQDIQWEVAQIRQSDIPSLARIPLPRLRRLRIRGFGFSQPRDLDILNKFTNLRWLDCESSIARRMPTTIDKKPSVVLPNLQVLWYKVQGTFEFPFKDFILPSLRYLSLHIDEISRLVPLSDILSSYRQTLQSFTSRVIKTTKSRLVLRFPPWNDFPKLRELKIDRQWTTYFHPLPPNHPLNRLDAQHGSLGAINSFIEGANMDELILQRTRWTGDGGITGRNEKLKIDKVGMDCLLEQAESRQVVFKITWDGDHFPSRDEVIITTPTAIHEQHSYAT
ncbi:hypothetical protein CPB86DRAFT_797373 [Serendipita vermifera]|nr:hypothetical protein CPB86DRAFT_797373 [Serendipita vermifera]